MTLPNFGDDDDDDDDDNNGVDDERGRSHPAAQILTYAAKSETAQTRLAYSKKLRMAIMAKGRKLPNALKFESGVSVLFFRETKSSRGKQVLEKWHALVPLSALKATARSASRAHVS